MNWNPVVFLAAFSIVLLVVGGVWVFVVETVSSELQTVAIGTLLVTALSVGVVCLVGIRAAGDVSSSYW